MKKIIFCLFVVVAAGAFTAFTQKENARLDAANPIAGKWLHQFSGVSVLLTANADFTSTLSVNGHVTSTGTYEVLKDVVTLINKTEPRNNCIGVRGLYNFSIKGNELTMKLKDEPCTGRAQAVVGTWMKQ